MALSPEAALDYLRRAHAQNRIGHAYLISGPAGSGKRQLVEQIARLVNPDDGEQIQIAEPESKSRRIVIDQVRALEHALQMRAADGRRKIAAIIDADRLQPQAANAFLKTLEEPPDNSLLLLVTALPEALPDTIVSRCISIPLAAPAQTSATTDEAELVELLNSATTGNAGVQGAYRLAQSFQRLLASVRAEIQEENAVALKAEETRYQNTTDGAWLNEREDYFKALTESRYVQRRARLVEIVYAWWSDVLRAKNGLTRSELPDARNHTSAVAQKLTTPQILRRIRRVEELRDHLGRNVQEALAIEVGFLALYVAA
jgi:DNA polymerase-3 subunit delta'